ncbi:MAG: VanZ family protein [Acidobacteriota bacterium]
MHSASNEAESGPGVWPLLRAVLVSAVVILSAPFIGQFRAWLGDAFPGRLVLIVGGGVAVAVVAALIVAVARIRSHYAARYGAIAGALAIATIYASAVATGWPEVDVVERVHFVEYGLIGLLFYLAWRPLGDPSIIVLPMLAGVMVGSVEEWFQWFIPVRVGEVHDVALDLVAVGCGLLFVMGVDPPTVFRRRLSGESRAWLGGVGGLAVLVSALFFNAVHLGYDVSRDGITFRSHATAAQLDAHAADRAARWRTAPPTTLRRVSREDQYMDEAVWHVRARNTAPDAWTAWQENRILELFYAPVLDTPSYISATGHRWPAEQRKSIEAQVVGVNGSYVSRAEPYPVFAWPKPVFWTGVLSVMSGLVWTALRERGPTRPSHTHPRPRSTSGFDSPA